MARVSLIFPLVPGRVPTPETVAGFQNAVEAAGHDVEVIGAAAGAGWAADEGAARGWRMAEGDRSGRAAAAVAGLRASRGDVVLVIDPAQGYGPEDALQVLAAVVGGTDGLVVASRFVAGTDPARAGGFRRLVQRLTGTSDPLSGLVGMGRAALDRAAADLETVGTHFTPELLSKVQGGRRDVLAGRASRPGLRLGFADVRHLKRLSDHRYGNLSRLLQFCIVGASGMVIDLSCYALFQWLLRSTRLAETSLPGIGPLDLATAAVLAVGIALTWNFSLNRRLTFSYARHGSFLKQYLAYALSNALAVSMNLLLRLKLPQHVPFFDEHRLAAAVVGIVLATGLSFSMSRWLVFRGRKKHPGPPSGADPDSDLAAAEATTATL